MTVTVRAAEWDDPAGAALRAAQQREIADAFGSPDSEPGAKPDAGSTALFLLAEHDGVAIGCGALRRIDARTGEVKRMYVVPDARGSGAAVLVLRALERAARGYGWERLLLETGDELPAAMRFYRREGFSPVPCWGAYAASPQSRCFEKSLGQNVVRAISSADAAG